MIAMNRSSNNLLSQWRQQLLTHCDPRSVAARKGFVALTFIDHANTSSVFVDIKSLSVVLVFEDESHRYDRCPLRLCCYDVSRISNGVLWGGANNCRQFKDLTLVPRQNARGRRLDIAKHELLALALKLNCRLSRAARHSAAPWPSLRLPRLWAGFRARVANELWGAGPEFERAVQMQRAEPIAFFRDTARHIDGLTAYPMDWVSGQLNLATAIFAEVTPGMRRQVGRIGNLPDGLVGFQGASAFDFYNSRFRELAGKPRRARRNGGACGHTRHYGALTSAIRHGSNVA
jgi:hypothetical protein